MKIILIFSSFYILKLLTESEGLLGIPEFIEFGKCAKVPLMKNFDPVKYQGIWFDILRVPNEYHEGSRCISQNYTWEDKENAMRVISEALTMDGRSTTQEAMMEPISKEDLFPDVHLSFMCVDAVGVPKAPYKVLWTDYVSTACVYSCLPYYGAFRAEFAWILSRFHSHMQEDIQVCLDLFNSYRIETKKLMPVQQGDVCSYKNNNNNNNNNIENGWNSTRKISPKLLSPILFSEQFKVNSNSTSRMESLTQNQEYDYIGFSKSRRISHGVDLIFMNILFLILG